MLDHYDLVRELTRPELDRSDQSGLLAEFAGGLGWHPSDELHLPATSPFAPVHLLVEHGLRNTAVLSFLSGAGYPALNTTQRQSLLGLSYNNLVDWHVAIDVEGVSYVYNRAAPPEFASKRARISRTDTRPLTSAAFQDIADPRPTPNLPALDDALIRTISNWKRQLGSIVPDADTSVISELFNSVIFLRAVEDHVGRTDSVLRERRRLVDALRLTAAPGAESVSVVAVIRSMVQALGLSESSVPISMEVLGSLGELPIRFLGQLCGEFYQNRYAAYYRYDFSVMSRHALSRIYEHYVSLLRPVESDQLVLLPSLPEEQFSRALGQVYTPEFIARFFAKYAREHFRGTRRPLQVLDPACGSGIFLRMFLEAEFSSHFEPEGSGPVLASDVELAFDSVTGIDIDLNACHATQLSLSLLHLTLQDEPSTHGRVIHDNALSASGRQAVPPGSVDLLIANPPYVSFELQDDATRSLVTDVLGDAAVHRPDTYLAFVAQALDALRPGGLGLFILPQTFLMTKSALPLRRRLAQETWIRCIADLSTVPVFEKTGVYPVLLAFEKRLPGSSAPRATLARCRDQVGEALARIVSGVPCTTPDFDVFEVGQDNFLRNTWIVLPPAEDRLVRAMADLPRLHEFLEVRQGMISGADSVFIIPESTIPNDGRELFKPFLSDRSIDPFDVPEESGEVVFIPYDALGERLTEDRLRREFPLTWAYLESHRDALSHRKPVQNGDLEWWRPTRPRDPAMMFRPKIVTPHVVILPQFALDLNGSYAVSHSPYLFERKNSPESDIPTLLKYFTAVLNSSTAFWHINGHARRYGGQGPSGASGRRGYALLEVRELKETPVPDPRLVSASMMKEIGELVDKRVSSSTGAFGELERQLDERIAELYGLSPEERASIGIEASGA